MSRCRSVHGSICTTRRDGSSTHSTPHERSSHMPLTWTDQPAILDALNVVASISLREIVAEIRESEKKPGTFYLTAGTLFGSETVYCLDWRTLLITLDRVSHKRSSDKPMTLPPGATLIDQALPAFACPDRS